MSQIESPGSVELVLVLSLEDRDAPDYNPNVGLIACECLSTRHEESHTTNVSDRLSCIVSRICGVLEENDTENSKSNRLDDFALEILRVPEVHFIATLENDEEVSKLVDTWFLLRKLGVWHRLVLSNLRLGLRGLDSFNEGVDSLLELLLYLFVWNLYALVHRLYSDVVFVNDGHQVISWIGQRRCLESKLGEVRRYTGWRSIVDDLTIAETENSIEVAKNLGRRRMDSSNDCSAVLGQSLQDHRDV